MSYLFLFCQKMVTPTYKKLSQTNITSFKIFTMILLGFSIKTQALNVSYDNIAYAASDYGGMYHYPPLAVAYPKTVLDISNFIRNISTSGNSKNLTIAARGNGHSIQGQSQASNGVVFDMTSLAIEDMTFHIVDVAPFVDVSAGTFWKNILIESLRYGYAPKVWTDYLYLTVGGTLSNAGIGGQAFRHGPQIDNVLYLQVVTGKGDIFNCSRDENANLFYGVLGGLGQFGIITRARISLEPAPSRVKWIKALYREFPRFSKDLENLISSKETFDYIEGFVLVNQVYPTGVNNSGSSNLNTKTLFELEVATYYNLNDILTIDQKLNRLLRPLSYIPGSLTITDVSYLEFLDRVHTTELELRMEGLWEVTHPWLNLLVPRSSIQKFIDKVFGKIIKETVNGPILIYPVNKTKWQNRTSLVTPDEDIFYQVAILSSAPPLPLGSTELEKFLTQNEAILEYCKEARLGVKEYLPHYTTQQDWKEHFGLRWDAFVARKSTYDPFTLLSPGQMIFRKEIPAT